MVQAIMAQLIEHGEVRRGYLGLAVQALNVELAEAFGLDRHEGIVVVEVEPETAGAKAGIESGDIITQVGDRRIRRLTDFYGQAAVIFTGQRVPMELLRDGRSRRVTLDVQDDHLEKVTGERIDRRLTATELQNFRNQDDTGLGAGVLVTDVAQDSRAWQYGLRPGDVVVAANRRAIRDLADLREAADLNSTQLLLRVYRSGQFGYVAIR
jgi:S1-C subfamily serine protease